MGKNHLLRIAAPQGWSFNRRKSVWTARPLPGPHAINNCVTTNFVLKELLDHAKTTKEVKKILNDGDFVVDKKVRKDYKYPVGFMDIIEIPKLKEYYRTLYLPNGRLSLISIEEKDSNKKLLKVVRKTAVKKGKIQLTFHDGRNITMDNFDGKVGDTALFDLEKNNVIKFISLDKGTLVFLNGGGHIGSIGKVKEIIRESNLAKPKVLVEIDGKDYITFMDYAFVIGNDKPELNL